MGLSVGPGTRPRHPSARRRSPDRSPSRRRHHAGWPSSMPWPAPRRGPAARPARRAAAGPQRPGPDGHRRRQAQQQAEDRQVVGAEAGASQTVPQRLDRPLDRRPETTIEHPARLPEPTERECGPRVRPQPVPSTAMPTGRPDGLTTHQMGVLDGEDVSDREHPQRGPGRAQRERQDDPRRGAACSGRGHPRAGRVDDGSTVSDTEPEEVKRKISSLAVAPVEWEGHKINLIDTPATQTS